ncbi:hypothetical protein DE146DRAFT_681628 [Phaeosphaeria sp. MPI-PUGE-AT-0046c]|nr:hypothetical protein DE146DRAFT_681628 [Phaeosphaeria sp. MPI-PUGE-AT-0046c]
MDWQDAISNAHVEAVDLTCSSPEPEQRSRSALQQQLPNHSKVHPRSESANRRIRKHAVRTSGFSQRESSSDYVDPQHLARIIDTSSSTAIKSVLLELCKLSPALSGALARGLAVHSTFAEDLIKRHQHTQRVVHNTSLLMQDPSTSRSPSNNVRAPHTPFNKPVKSEKSPDQAAYEQMKQHLAPRLAAHVPAKTRAQPSSSASRFHNSQSTDSIKQSSLVDNGDSDSDMDNYIPREFPLIGEQPVPIHSSRNHTARWTGAGSTLGTSYTPQVVAPSQKGVSEEHAQGTCIKCLEVLENGEEDGLCFHHKGPKICVDDTSTCGACMKSWSGPACDMGAHVTSI